MISEDTIEKIQMRHDSGLDQGGGSREREKSSDNGYIWKVETARLSDELGLV